MKRKFTNVFLLVAIGIAALTAFVSCKDYEDDLRTESEIQNQELENLLRQDFQRQLTTLDNTLRGLITDLEGTVSEIKSCKCDTNALRENVLNIVKSYNYLTQNDIKDFVDTDSILSLIDKVLQSEATQDSLEKYFNLALDKAIQTQDFIDDLISQLTNDTYNSAFSEWVNNQIQEFTSDETFITNLTQNSSFIENISQNMMIPKDTVAKYMWEIFGPYKETLDTTLFDMNAAIVQLTDTLTNYVTKEQLAYEVDSIWREFSTVKTLTKNAQERADSAYQKAQDAAQAAANAATAAANAQNTADAAKTLAEAADKLAKELQTTVTGLKEAVDDLKPRVKKLEDDYATLSEFVNQVEGRVSKVELRVDTAMINAQKALDDVAALKDAYEATKKALEDKDIELDSTMTAHFDSINRRCDNIEKEIQEVLDSAYSLYLMGMDALQLVQQEMNYRIDSLAIDTRERLGQQGERIDNLEDSVASHLVRINTNELNIQNLMERMANAEKRIPALETRMDSLEGVCDSILKRVVKLEEDVNDLYSKYEGLNDRLNKLITGIVVQGVYNPIFGAIYTPFGVETNILATFYGESDFPYVQFPTASKTFYYYSEKWDRERIYLDSLDVAICDQQMLTFENKLIYENYDGNAGTVYLTVNSATQQDFSGTQFELVNTKDESSPVTLGKLEKENDWVKHFGYTSRGVENNNLYRAKATILKDFGKAAPKINLSRTEVEELLKDMKNDLEKNHKVDISKIASAAYKVATSEILPAYGIKAPWTDSKGEHAVYSAYNLAATAVKPLGFGFLNDITPEYVPGLAQIENFVGEMVDGIKFDMPQFNIETLKAPTISEIKLLELDDNLLAKFKIAVDIDTTIVLRLDTLVTPPDINLEPITVNIQDYIKTITDTIKGQKISFDEFPVWVRAPQVEIGEIRVPKGDGTGEYLVADPPTVSIEDSVQIWVQVPSQEIGDIVLELHPEVDAVVITPEVKVGDIHLKLEKGMKIWVRKEIDMSGAVVELYNKVKTPIEDVNKMIADINSFMDDVNDALQELKKVNTITKQVEDAKQDIKDKVSEYLTKFGNKILPWLTPSKYLSPILLGEGTDDFAILSTTRKNPSHLSSNTISFVATTTNAEFLTPVYKKWIAVTNVYNLDRSKSAKGSKADAACKAARDAANQGQMNKILDGNIRRFDATFQKGFIYEVSYQALDYTGHVGARKYYLMVK